jgi:hypothetical protein
VRTVKADYLTAYDNVKLTRDANGAMLVQVQCAYAFTGIGSAILEGSARRSICRGPGEIDENQNRRPAFDIKSRVSMRIHSVGFAA